ncbi:MAG: ABC transporter permease, partial [Gemmatimonadales bacterium]
MESFLKDLRFAIRTLLKRPGFTIVAALVIALGIGANTAIFSVVNAVLLAPLPVTEPDDLVVPDVIAPSGFSISLSIPNFRDWSARSRTFESWGANAGRWRTLTGGDRPEVIRIRLVLGDFFQTLGVSAALGRTFTGAETWEGAEPVAVVTHRFWERRLGADPNVIGASITLDGQPYSIIGVMAPEFVFPSADTEVFLPMGFFSDQMCWEERGCSQGTWAIARLAAGSTLAMAQEDMDRVTREITEEEGDQQAVTRLESLKQAYVGDVRTQIWILMGAVVFVLLIACANVASLLLARGESRRQEIALRMAIGAGRGR